MDLFLENLRFYYRFQSFRLKGLSLPSTFIKAILNVTGMNYSKALNILKTCLSAIQLV